MFSQNLLKIARFGSQVLKNKKKKVTPKRSVLKKNLQVDSTYQGYSISGQLSDPLLFVKKLIIRDRTGVNVYEVINDGSNEQSKFHFSLDHSILSHLVDNARYHQAMKETAVASEHSMLIDDQEGELLDAENTDINNEEFILTGRFSLWIQFEKPLSEFLPKTLKKWDAKGLPSNSFIEEGIFSREIILGRFANTKLSAPLKPIVSSDFSNKAFLYTNLKGNLQIILNKEPKFQPKLQIDSINQISKHSSEIKGKIFTRHAFIKKGTLLLVHRETGEKVNIPTDWLYNNEISAQKFGLYRYNYTSTIDWNSIYRDEPLLKEGVYDAFMSIEYYHRSNISLLRLGRARYITRQLIEESYTKNNSNTMVISPYFTIGHRNLSFETTEFTNENHAYLSHLMKFAPLYRLFAAKNTWVIGERPYKAQDNGYHFFKYMRENYPQNPVYYVIDPQSPEFDRVRHLGNTLEFKSKKHIYHTLMAKKIIGTHHGDYLYPIRSKPFQSKMNAEHVFLQHGVLGTKNLENHYGKNSPSFNTDLFLVSSEREKQVVTQDMGYAHHEVLVTGLARFDALLTKDTDLKRQILIIPTWRTWLQTPLQFFESEYYLQYRELLSSPILHDFVKKHKLEIVFCLHPNMQQYSTHFTDLPITVINQGERDVQDLMKESMLMITDYSSVAFDFSFLKRPVIYFQFDGKRFIGPKGSHYDLEQELPGPIARTSDEVLEQLEISAKNHFEMEQLYKERSEIFLTSIDVPYAQKIYESISNFEKQTKWWENVSSSEAANILFKMFRKSRFYFPTMKFLYRRMLQVLPLNEKLIVFESGLGKQYSDSPRYIYEEIKKRNLDYKIVWVYNKKIRLNDPNVTVVKRLSPSYFYYLATANFWVNNQNFPHYFTRRKETTYIQTWHGTPLKKMLFDLDEIHGRDSGYVERVTNSIKQWSVLLSPSAYASNIFKSAFNYNGPIFESGYPRNDLFFENQHSEETMNSIRSQLQIDPNKKVILYAPTFRDHQSLGNGKFYFDYPFDFDRVSAALGNEYIFLIRTHVLVTKKPRIPAQHREQFIDVTSYPDIQELYLVTDLLITDYSSVFFDFANLNRPILFYAYDLDLYRDTLRGFYLDYYKDLPGPILETEDAFIESLTQLKELEKTYQPKLDQFRQTYCGNEDGKAAERVVNQYFNKSSHITLTEQIDGSFQ